MTQYRARSAIRSRMPQTEEQRKAGEKPVTHEIPPNSRFDPEKAGISPAQLKSLAARGHISAIDEQSGANLDVAETLAAFGPAPVPTTTQRDASSGGAAPQTRGGFNPGNTSKPATASTKAPLAGGPSPDVSTSSSGAAGAPAAPSARQSENR